MTNGSNPDSLIYRCGPSVGLRYTDYFDMTGENSFLSIDF